MTQPAAVVAREPDAEAILASAELAHYLEQQSSAIAPPSDDIAGSAEALLPVDDGLAQASTSDDPRDNSPYGDSEPTPHPINDSKTAQKTKESAKLSSEAILRMAGWIQSMRSRSSRKQYRAFVRQLLGWVGNEAQKYLEIAKAFGDFDFSRLGGLEPFTLLRLRTKKFAPVVARLRDEVSITQLRVQELIEELLPKKPRKQKSLVADGNAVLEKHANTEDGTFYFTLKEANVSESIGTWLKKEFQSKTLGQVLSEAMQQDKQEQISALREQIKAEAERQAHNRFEMVEFGLKQQIAYLEAQLAAVKSSEIVKPSTATGLESSERLEVIESPTATGLEPVQAPEATLESSAFTGREDAVASEQVQSAIGLQLSDDEVALASDNLSEDLEIIVASLASIQPTEPECSSTSATDGSQPVAEPSHSQLSDGSATDCQILAADWDLIQQLRHAESSLQKIDTQIQGLNSPFAKSCSNTVVERELKQLRSLQISKIVDLINSNFIPAYYEEQENKGRVVLDPKYASDFLMQAQSWADVVLVVGSDGKQLVNAVKEWSKESKQLLVQLVSEYLETDPSAFNQINWLPKKLLGRALSSLSFTVQRIKKSDNLVDEPEIEYISGCQFNSFSNLGTRHEQWVFLFNDNLIPVFCRSEFAVEKF